MTRSAQVTVRKLAKEANLDTDSVLIRLWEAGITGVDDGNSVITAAALPEVRDRLGIQDGKVLKRPEYWMRKFRLDEKGFFDLLGKLGIQMNPKASRIPRGSVQKLKSALRIKLSSETSSHSTGNVLGTEEPPAVVAESLVWRNVGQVRDLKWLDEREVGLIHDALVRDFATSADPIEPSGVRDVGLLQSAVGRPKTSLGRTMKYPTVEMSTAALVHSLIHNHPFHNGNKRTALVSMLVVLDKNEHFATCRQDDVFQFVLRVAKHALVDNRFDALPDREVLEMAEWIRPIERGERPLPFHKLRRILASYACDFDHGASGSRINISRNIESPRGRLWRPRERTLQTQVCYGGEGREVERNTISKIRKELELDDEHGVDSGAFYGAEPTVADDFILTYQSTLRRLSRL